MTRKPDTVAFWRGRLPHWEVVDGRYFVTMHLAGAIPEQGQERIHAIAAELEKRAERDHEGKLKLQREMFAEMEAWLDRAPAVAHLGNPQVARMVMEAVEHREGREWNMFEYVVMPNHLHLFFEVAEEAPAIQGEEGRLKGILERFKRWTGHQAAKLIELPDGRFWQDEWFDHWSRSDEEDERIVAYIRRNPVKAKLVAEYRDWQFASWASRVGAASRAAPASAPEVAR